MLNLKKGLALVLAAATAFTFAPVTSFAADPVTSDSLTTTAGIDSTPANITLANGATTANAVWLKEHNDKSQSGPTTVEAYRITITKYKNDDGTYSRGLDFIASTSDPSDKDSVGTAAINKSVSGTAASLDAVSSKTFDDSSYATDTYLLKNTASKPKSGTKTGELDDLAGAYFKLKEVKGKGATYTVTVSSLGSFDSNAQALDTSKFTVTVPEGKESFSINETSATVVEGTKIDVPWVISNHASDGIATVEYSTDNKSVVSLYDTTKSASYDAVKAKLSNENKKLTETIASADATQTGKYSLYAVAAGEADITFQAKKADGTVVSEIVLSVTVNPANGKLYVSYTDNNGIYQTFTDDKAFQYSQANSTRHLIDSGELEVADGNLVQTTETVKNGDGYLYDVANKAVLNKSGTSDGATAIDDLADGDKSKVSFTYKTLGSTEDNAQLLTSDGTKTVKINASTDVPDAKITYSLVAFDHFADTNGSAVNHKVTANAAAYAKASYSMSGVVGDHTVASSIGQWSQNVYTEAAAKKYGAIDKDGLVTLKTADETKTLYAVVTVKGDKDANRKTSTIVVPIITSEQEPVALKVTDSKNFTEGVNSTIFTNYDGNEADRYTLYLSTADRKTDDLNIISNVADSYITVQSSDPKVVTADFNHLTAVKEGKATITVQTQSAPNVAGIVAVKIKVVVNNKLSTNAVSGQGVSVNKENPSKTIKATPAVTGTTVIFDRENLYKKVAVDKQNPSGYAVIGPTESGYGDVAVTTTGNVTYQKNSGTVYVRAYARGNDKYNPSTWQYFPVNYGEQSVDTSLNVDTTPIILDVNGTKAINATASTGTAITYTSADPTVASVDANGTVTANKAGVTTVTVATKTSDGKDGDSATVAVIVRGSETITDDTVKPAKVTGLKVSNKKGAYVSVKWTSQGKNINYRVYKKVGKGKWVGKNVAGSKTTLSVKKGAKVQVKVKAYVKDANGKTTWGPKATKAKTFKTDKK